MSLEKLSPCKVNLLLNILGKRADGFHELQTIMQPVRLCDRLTFNLSEKPGVALTCNDPSLAVDSTNLVFRAAEAFLTSTKINQGVSIRLEKRIPMGAGLGGGSGNAATTLLALNELFDLPLKREDLHHLASALGSDVPFFLQEKPALATGRGEIIEPTEPFPALHGKALLLVYPGFGVPTAWAYRRLASFPEALLGRPSRAAELLERLLQPDLGQAQALFFNSLEAPVLEKYPLLAIVQDFLRTEGALVALMSGSGSTTFAIVENRSHADALREKVKGKFAKFWTAVVPL